jgi:hypothetical protein
MSEMLERVARAIWSARNANRDFETLLVQTKRGLRDQARAAIEAMQKPTKEMVHYGEALSDFTLYSSTADDRRAEMAGAYGVMIEVALGTYPGTVPAVQDSEEDVFSKHVMYFGVTAD